MATTVDEVDQPASTMMSSSGRTIKQTEKGRLFHLGQLQSKRNEIQKKLFTELNELKEMINSENQQASEVTKKADEVQQLSQQFMILHGKCQILVSEEDDGEVEDVAANKVDEAVHQVRLRYNSWLSKQQSPLPPRPPKTKSSRSSSKSSHRSSRSKSSKGISEKLAMERAKLAEMKVAREYEKSIETKRQELKEIESQAELAKTEAKVQIYERELNADVGRDIEIDKLLESIPKYEDGAYANSFVANLPKQGLRQPPNFNDGASLNAWDNFNLPYINNTTTSSSQHTPVLTCSGPSTLRKTIIEEPTKTGISFTMSTSSFIPKSTTPVTSIRQTVMSPIMSTLPTQPPSTSNTQAEVKLAAEVSGMVKELQAPSVKLDIFKGDPTDYPFFITTFIQAVEEKTSDEKGRLARLIQHTEGAANELVRSCVYLPDNICYQRAKLLLKQKFGDPFKIANEYRKQLSSWPRLKANDVASFTKFESFLIKYQSSMNAVGRSTECNPELLQILQSKLPPYLQDRWNRKVYQIRKDSKNEVTLEDFIRRISEETTIISDPLFSREALDEYTKGKDSSTSRRGTKSFRTNTKEICICCKKKWHDLEKCYKYVEMDLPERKQFVFRNRLCFRCLEPVSETHVGKTCKKPKTCSECQKQHPSSLHKETISSNYINNEKAIGLCVVPIKLYHQDNPQNSITTLALLDNGSQGTFISEKVLNRLDTQKKRTCLEIQTITGKIHQNSFSVPGLVVSGAIEPGPEIKLPKVFSRTDLPINANEVPTPSKLQKWKYLHCIFPYLQETNKLEVGMLIGSNCPRALEPLTTIQSQNGGPYAIKSRLGWCVAGPMDTSELDGKIQCHNIKACSNDQDRYFSFKQNIKDMEIKQCLLAMYNLDFSEVPNRKALSIEDERFLRIMDENVTKKGGKYYLPLPLKTPEKEVPNNRIQALQRANWLRKRLLNNDKMFNDYKVIMQHHFDKGYAKVADTPPTPNKTWYIPHHGVYHPKKPDKIRVVFDCSCTYKDYCLNKELLQGPDLTNQLIGVLSRFREGEVAIMADIEKMFYQVRVPTQYYDYFRFVWWPDGDLTKEPTDCQMVVHLFGAISSPSVCNYALKRAAADNKDEFGEEAASTLKRNFYVDDLLKSFMNSEAAQEIMPKVVNMTKAGGFRLTQFHSNNRKFLATIPEDDRSKQLKDFDLSTNPLPAERALGMNWCPESDTFGFKIKLKDVSTTRRGVLSTISSIYDPLGIAAPYLLEGKQILQQICAEKGWDDPLSDGQVCLWNRWIENITKLEKIRVDRCIYPQGFGEIKHTSLHHFSDASSGSYGQVSYLRIVNKEERICCRLMIAKSRVAPRKRPTIPRLELTAAKLSVKVATSMKDELDIPIEEEFFWTDSQVVLAYISNEVARFHLFVANRVKMIREESEVTQWNYVPSKENPADDTTRGLKLTSSDKDKRWINGPDFLYKPRSNWPKQPKSFTIDQDDKELKKIKCNSTLVKSRDIITILEERISTWLKMKRVVVTILSWYRKKSISVEALHNAEFAIIRLVQRRAFSEEVESLQRSTGSSVKKSSPLLKLCPFIDDNGILRIGGRIEKADIPFAMKHPIILPRRCITTNLIILYFHQRLHHAGRNATLNEIRTNGYWIINGNSLVRFVLSNCVKCKILRGKTSTQQMSDLPQDRLVPSPPFTYCGLDMFGPFIIRERRSDLKRYGIIFTCLNSRAVHLEAISTMDTDSFILCLRRFIGRRGEVRTIRCDNGSNFVGAKLELQKAVQEMDDERITNYLLNVGTDFISWKHNPPYASNFGGVWERLIRSARAILDGLMMSHGHSLNDESFRTLLVEVEAIINSRPITTDTLNSPDCLPLSPINLLTMKSKVIRPPPGTFQKEDLYCRRRWRRVQHLSNEFWSRWRREYLNQIQSRSKWQSKQRNINVGDVVIVKNDHESRNMWKMGIVVETYPSEDGNVRKVNIRQNGSIYLRPVNKLVVLVENNPTQEE